MGSTFLAFLLGEAFAPGYATRFCAGRDARHVRRGAVVAGLGLGLLFPGLVLIIAWYARAFVPSAPPGAALPSVIASVANPWLTGLLIAALLCAVMSSADSALNSATAIFVKGLFEDEWGWRGGERTLAIARWCTALLGVASIAIAAALLGAFICAVAAGLLLRGFARTRARLLLWNGLCFASLAVGNVLLYVDAYVFPSISLRLPIDLVLLAGGLVLMLGLIWDAKE